jgi:hypothetical protein
MRDHDDQRARAAYQTWGFGEISPDKLTVLNQWAGFLYDPLLDDRVRRIQENDDPMYGRAVLTEVHAGLKRTGGIRPPREFVLLDRSAIGLGSVFVRLRAELNWSALMREITADFSERALAERQAAALAAARMPTTP